MSPLSHLKKRIYSQGLLPFPSISRRSFSFCPFLWTLILLSSLSQLLGMGFFQSCSLLAILAITLTESLQLFHSNLNLRPSTSLSVSLSSKDYDKASNAEKYKYLVPLFTAFYGLNESLWIRLYPDGTMDDIHQSMDSEALQEALSTLFESPFLSI